MLSTNFRCGQDGAVIHNILYCFYSGTGVYTDVLLQIYNARQCIYVCGQDGAVIHNILYCFYSGTGVYKDVLLQIYNARQCIYVCKNIPIVTS
jgi:accessory colonization factor AcfC